MSLRTWVPRPPRSAQLGTSPVRALVTEGSVSSPCAPRPLAAPTDKTQISLGAHKALAAARGPGEASRAHPLDSVSTSGVGEEGSYRKRV